MAGEVYNQDIVRVRCCRIVGFLPIIESGVHNALKQFPHLVLCEITYHHAALIVHIAITQPDDSSITPHLQRWDQICD